MHSANTAQNLTYARFKVVATNITYTKKIFVAMIHIVLTVKMVIGSIFDMQRVHNVV